VLHSDGQCKHQRSAVGFSLLELIVVILLVSIVFTFAFNRYQQYPAAAERANFLAVNAQLKAVVNLLMMEAIASGNWQHLEALAGSNPMDLMLEPPANYRGEGDGEAVSRLPGHSWFFDVERGELVYRATAGAGLQVLEQGQWQAADTLRLRLTLAYDEQQGKRGWQGLLLSSEADYRWDSGAVRAMTESQAQ